MRALRILRQRLLSLLRRGKANHDLDRELQFHIEQLTREFMGEGMSESDARLAARRAFGSPSATREQCHDMRKTRFLEDIVQDLVHAVRVLRKSPAFTLTAVVSIGLGIGANTAIFSLVQKVVLDQLSVREPESLTSIARRNLQRPELRAFSYPFFRDLQTAPELPFEGFLAYAHRGKISLVDGEAAEPAVAELVSGNYFDLLGLRPAAGRLFTVDDDRFRGAHPVAVLSHNFWTRRFGGDPSIIDRTVRLNGAPFRVIGISARGFDGLDPGFSPDVRIPFTMEGTLHSVEGTLGLSSGASMLDQRGSWWLRIFGRLKPGVTLVQAGDSLQPLLMRNFELHSGSAATTEYAKKVRASERMYALPGGQGIGYQRRTYERALWVLSAIVSAVLLIACLNMAQLLLARAAAREREFSIRLAVGAGRGRLIRQLLTESLTLATIGGLAGIAIARVFGELLLALVVTDREHSTLQMALDWRVLLFNFAIASLAGVLFGLAPAWRAARQSLTPGLKGVHSRSQRVLLGRKLLVCSQVAISLTLLVGAGLFLRTLDSLLRMDLGLRADNLLQLSMDPANAGYKRERVPEFYRAVEERINALPGVQATAYANMRVINDSGWGSGIKIEGYTPREGDPGPLRNAVSAGYFRTLGIPLLAGRDFTPRDDGAAPKVAIVNETFARFYFGNQNPLGKKIGPNASSPPEYTIVGVAKDSKYQVMKEQTQRFWYAPYEQVDPAHSLTLHVRTASRPEAVITAIRREIAAIDKNVALSDIKTLERQIQDNLSIERTLATLSTFFGSLAALLTAIGLFGVLNYLVSLRQREIGIRVALGARPVKVSWTIARDTVAFAALGFAIGIPVAMALSRLLGALLFEIEPTDFVAVASASLAMAVVIAAAAFLPARKAAAVDPAVTLRAD